MDCQPWTLSPARTPPDAIHHLDLASSRRKRGQEPGIGRGLRVTELSLRTRVIVWGLSGGFCAFPGCRLQLVLQEGGGHALIGEIAHIVAESADGPRGESALNASQRSQPTNLVLLCANHHKEIDDLPDSYAVDVLIAIKRDHERWVRELGREPQDLVGRTRIASYVTEWAARVDAKSWRAWTWTLLAPDPWITVERTRQLRDIVLLDAQPSVASHVPRSSRSHGSIRLGC